MALFDNLVACWRFKKDSATQRDSGPNALTGTRVGSVTTEAAIYDNAAKFTAGTGNYVDVPYDSRIALWKGCSIGIVVKVNSYNAGSILSRTGGSPFPAGFRTQTGPNLFYVTEGGINKYELSTWVTAGSYHWVLVTVDGSGNMNCYVDGIARGGVQTTGYFWMSENQPLRFGAASAAFYGGGQNASDVSLDEVLMWDRELSAGEASTWYNSGAGTTIGETNLTMEEVGDYWVYQRGPEGDNKAIITRSGEYTVGTPASMELRAVNWTDGVTVVQDWTPMLSSTIGSGSWSASISVPTHSDWCKYQVRTLDSGGSVLETSGLSLGHVGVGAKFLCAGQSNMALMFDTNQATLTNPKTAIFANTHYSRLCGNGADTLLDRLQQGLNMPVALIATAVGGTGLVQDFGSGYWLHPTTGPYQNAVTKLNASGGDVEGILWHQGEADAEGGITKAAYEAGLTQLYDKFKTATGRITSQLSFGVAGLGNLATPTDANASAIRSAHYYWSTTTTGAYFLGSSIDLVRYDNYHWDTAYRTRAGRRWARSILFKNGIGTRSGAGGRIYHVYRQSASTNVDIYIDLDGAGSLVEADGTIDGNALTGIEISDDNFATTETISSTAFIGDKIRCVLAGLPAAPVKVRYLYGKNPTLTNIAYTNPAVEGDTLGLPVIETWQSLTESNKLPVYMPFSSLPLQDNTADTTLIDKYSTPSNSTMLNDTPLARSVASGLGTGTPIARAIDFPGGASTLVVDNQSIGVLGVPPVTNNFTWSGWVYFDTIGSREDFLCWKSTDGTDEIVVYKDAANVLTVSIKVDGGAATTMTGATLSATTWYMVTLVKNRDTWSLYLNTTLQDADVLAYDLTAHSGTHFYLGSNHTALIPNNKLNGRMASVSLWRYPIYDEQITTLYNGGNGLLAPFDGVTTIPQRMLHGMGISMS